MKIFESYKISVIGAGHVGLVTSACFSELGHRVICIDNDRDKISKLKRLIIPFYEPDLESLIIKNFKKHLFFSNSLEYAIKNSDIIFIAVGTPPKEDGSSDLSAIESISREIAINLNNYKLIVEKSTVPVQTNKKIKETILRYKKNNTHFDIASNPEFLREGSAVYDFFHPDRIIIGVESERAKKLLKNLYVPFNSKIIITDLNTAEIIKHASNSFLAMKISFINAIARICDLASANVKDVAYAIGLDKRIGKYFLNAGIGYGGFCFPKDLEAFMYISKKLGYDFNLLLEVKKINESQKLYFVEKIKERLWSLKDKKISILGLSFKPNTDDLRFAPSIDIINYLLSEGAIVYAYDPVVKHIPKDILKGKIYLSKDIDSAIKNSDCVCFLTEWDEFKDIDFKRIKKFLKTLLIADGRNIFDRKKLESLGFEYIGIGT